MFPTSVKTRVLHRLGLAVDASERRDLPPRLEVDDGAGALGALRVVERAAVELVSPDPHLGSQDYRRADGGEDGLPVAEDYGACRTI